MKTIRDEFEARYPMPFACGWNSMSQQYECIWPEHGGEDEVEAAIDQHNDRFAVWVASRVTLAIELPSSFEDDTGKPFGKMLTLVANAVLDKCGESIEAAGITFNKKPTV